MAVRTNQYIGIGTVCLGNNFILLGFHADEEYNRGIAITSIIIPDTKRNQSILPNTDGFGSFACAPEVLEISAIRYQRIGFSIAKGSRSEGRNDGARRRVHGNRFGSRTHANTKRNGNGISARSINGIVASVSAIAPKVREVAGAGIEHKIAAIAKGIVARNNRAWVGINSNCLSGKSSVVISVSV